MGLEFTHSQVFATKFWSKSSNDDEISNPNWIHKGIDKFYLGEIKISLIKKRFQQRTLIEAPN